MNRVWIWSDLHLGHANIPKFRSKVKTVEENTEILVENWKRFIKPDDTAIVVGDAAMTLDALHIIAKLPGEKILVIGNHDTQRGITPVDLAGVYKKITGLINYPGGFWISHAPIHPCELFGKKNIHGHMHNTAIADPNYINVNVDYTDMKPVLMDHIRSGAYTTHERPSLK